MFQHVVEDRQGSVIDVKVIHVLKITFHLHRKFLVDELNDLIFRELLSITSMWWKKCQIVIEFTPSREELVDGCHQIEMHCE
jgi:hypothetical protein